MAKRKKVSEPEQIKFEPNTETPAIEATDFVEIGGSPVPGLTLRHIFRGHTNSINRIAWSPDGKYLASPSDDATIRIWDESTGECVRILDGDTSGINSVAWSPNGSDIVFGCNSGVVNNVNIETCKVMWTVNREASVLALRWYPIVNTIIVGSEAGSAVWLLDANTGRKKNSIKGVSDSDYTYALTCSPDGKKLVFGTQDGDQTLIGWDVGQNHKIWDWGLGRTAVYAYSLSWSPLESILACGFQDNTIRVFNAKNGHFTKSLESHSSAINSLDFSWDGQILASASIDGYLLFWRTDTWFSTCQLKIEVSQESVKNNIAFHPHLPILATLGENDTIIRIWELDKAVLLGQAIENVNYTTAKLVLVGDSGVGKTGLGWRLAHGEFKEHASTHGQQFWSIPQLNLKRKDGTDCEAVLWDLAGQHVYRQVHSIFLENIAAALVLFDPTNRQDPLKGAQFWLEQLKGKGQLPPTVLVGARVDRGAPALSQAELDQFCQRYGIKGGYISTSALKGEGLNELLDIIKAQIPWNDMTATVTTVTFKRIKDYVLSLKEKTDRKGVLVDPDELQMLLASTDEDWTFSDAEMMTAVGHLETHGYVSILHNSAGEKYILLTPDLLVNLAASIMLQADKNARELGAVSETELLQGKYPFDELKGLEKSEQQILIDAAILRFLEHNICFRDTFNDDTLLIFPSLIKQKRPLQDDIPATDDISYVVRGRVENLYASLVVLLGYTPSFSRINQWQNQAQYEMDAGQVCGFRSIEEREGELELVLYYGDKMPQRGRERFQELFEQFLYKREVEVTRFPPVICKNSHQQKRSTVIERVRDKKPFMFCDECGDKVLLPDFDKPQSIGIGASPWLQREEAMAHLRSSYEKHLTNIKSYRRGWATPRAYLSYLPAQKDWAKKLVHDLQDAGVYIVEKPEDLKPEDFAILLDTPAYRKAFQNSDTTLNNDPKVIKARLVNNNKKLLSLGCEGKFAKHEFKFCTPGDFCDDSHYSVSLFNLVMELYAIPLNLKGFEALRQSLHEQWENTLAGKEVMETSGAIKIFISYSHKDEAFKDELVTMLAGLQRRKIVDAWQDRRIEVGDEWYQSIQNAMDECDLALLLISPDYLASRFIQEQEQPKFLQRRAEMKTRVIPIIVRPCMWQSEPTLSGIQAMPRDDKAIITFPKETGARDQVWTTIAQEIEKRAKGKSS